MNIKRFIIPLLAGFLLFSGCSDAAKNLDTAAFAEKILDSGAFETSLELIETETVTFLYIVEEADVADCLSYMYPGASAEELTIFTCADKAAAERVFEAAGDYLERRFASFSEYLPAEADKLAGVNPILYGNCVIIAVVSDSAAFDEAAGGFLK